MPEKAKSVAQFKYLQDVANGSIKSPSLTAAKAREMLGPQTPAGLPKRARKKP
jgi:hypothetical protein